MADTTQVPNALLDGVVQYVNVSSQMAKRAIDEITVHREAQRKAAALRSPLLEKMVSLGVIPPEHKTACDAMLGAHDTTMQLLTTAVEKLAAAKQATTTKQAGDLGHGVDDPVSPPAVNSLNSPFVGSRDTGLKESDRRLLAVIGK